MIDSDAHDAHGGGWVEPPVAPGESVAASFTPRMEAIQREISRLQAAQLATAIAVSAAASAEFGTEPGVPWASAAREKAVGLHLAALLRLSSRGALQLVHDAQWLQAQLPTCWRRMIDGRIVRPALKQLVGLADGLTEEELVDDDRAAADLAERLFPHQLAHRLAALRDRLNVAAAAARAETRLKQRCVAVRPQVDRWAVLGRNEPAGFRVAGAAAGCDPGADHPRRARRHRDRRLGRARTRARLGLRRRRHQPGRDREREGVVQGGGRPDRRRHRARRLPGAPHPRRPAPPPAAAGRELQRIRGCARPADHCNIDHVADVQCGGHTNERNLQSLCSPSHLMKRIDCGDLDVQADRTIVWSSTWGTRLVSQSDHPTRKPTTPKPDDCPF